MSAKDKSAALIAPFRARIEAIRPKLGAYAYHDINILESVLVRRLAGKNVDLHGLEGKVAYYTDARIRSLELIARVEAEIQKHADAPDQDRYINLWRFHADLVECDAFLGAYAVLVQGEQP